MSNVITKVKEWLTPALVLVIGYFAKGKMDEINRKLDQLTNLQINVAALTVMVENNKDDISILQQQYLSLAAKKEDEITIDKLLKGR